MFGGENMKNNLSIHQLNIMCFLVLFLIVLCFTITVHAFYTHAIKKVNEVSYIEIPIKSGDTLWELAKKFSSKEKDVRKAIDKIRYINHLNTLDLYPGQIIKIPIE